MFSGQFHSPGLPVRATQEFSGNARADAWWEGFPCDWVPAGKGDVTVFFVFLIPTYNLVWLKLKCVIFFFFFTQLAAQNGIAKITSSK